MVCQLLYWYNGVSVGVTHCSQSIYYKTYNHKCFLYNIIYYYNYLKKVLELEEEKGEWGFKALKQMTKINFKIVSTISFINFIVTYYKISQLEIKCIQDILYKLFIVLKY